jgi:amino acid transporter
MGIMRKKKICMDGLVAAIVGLFIFGVILGAAAIILGLRGLKKGRKYSEIAIVVGIIDAAAAILLIGLWFA